MTTSLSPHARIELCEKMCHALYRKEEEHLRRTLDEIIIDNSEYHGNNQPCMRFRSDIFYLGGQTVSKRGFIVNLCHKEIRPRMYEYLAAVDRMHSERSVVMGYFQQMFRASSYAEDFIRVLPLSLHKVVRQHDRHFLEGEGVLIGDALTRFLEDNVEFLNTVKRRLTMNLLEA